MLRERSITERIPSRSRRCRDPSRRAAVGWLAYTVLFPTGEARAQQPLSQVIGYLSDRSAASDAHLIDAFRQGLREAGLVEGKDLSITFRFAEGKSDALAALAADLVGRHVDLLFAAGGISAVAAKAASPTLPIVFVSTSDPLANHLVASLSRPGANVTGVSLTAVALAPKRLDLLFELLPQSKRFGLLVNPTTGTSTPSELSEVPVVAQAKGLQVTVMSAAAESDLGPAFASMRSSGIDAVLVGTDPLFVKTVDRLVELARLYAIPAIYDRREFPQAGGLMSYGSNIAAGYRRGGAYAGQVLKGTRPSDLPVEQAAIFELVVNMRTAKDLGIVIPPAVLAGADELIE